MMVPSSVADAHSEKIVYYPAAQTGAVHESYGAKYF